MSYVDKAELYIDWRRKHDLGRVPRFTAEELGAIRAFAQWMDDQNKPPDLGIHIKDGIGAKDKVGG